jgi:4'-phosphopantetheinyl transferase
MNPAVHVYRLAGDWRESGHALLGLLSRYTGMEPAAIRLARSEKGKPYLPDSDVFFNLSHTSNLALIAVARGVEVGVDVEAIQPRVDPEAIAGRFFHPAEREALEMTRSGAKLELFYRIWVRKEAFVKAVGGGLSMGLEQFSVHPVCLNVHPWTIWDLDAGAGYAAALAVRAPACVIQCFDLGGGRF